MSDAPERIFTRRYPARDNSAWHDATPHEEIATDHNNRFGTINPFHEYIRADLAAAQPAPDVAGLVDAANFLSDRLHEFDLTDDADDMCRNFIGHVEPAHARLCAAIAAWEGKTDD